MPETLSGKLSKPDQPLMGKLSTQPQSYSPYTGDYEVTPKAFAQTLETAGKVLSKNVVIAAVPYHEVQNNSGGLTAHIAEEV